MNTKSKLTLVEPQWTIEKNIPMPERRDRGGKYPGLTAVLKKMEVGDSILIPNAKVQALGSRLAGVRPLKFSMRSEGTGVRAWRIE
jgi:hypothetical protein